MSFNSRKEDEKCDLANMTVAVGDQSFEDNTCHEVGLTSCNGCLLIGHIVLSSHLIQGKEIYMEYVNISQSTSLGLVSLLEFLTGVCYVEVFWT